MQQINEILNKIKSGVLLFDGGFGTELYNRGIFINRCFDEVNLSNPALVKQIHDEYLKAGADVIETNTFGANKYKLSRYQLADKVYTINLQGAKLAKESAGNDAYVAGAIGPLGIKIEPLGITSVEEAKEAFTEQIEGLVDGGVDMLIFETFIYPEELLVAIEAAKEICDLPVIAEMTIDEDCTSLTGAEPEFIISMLSQSKADVLGVNSTVGPQVMLRWLERVRPLTDKPLAVMPSAGKPRNIDGRNIYLTSPEYMGEYAKHFVQAGASIIGGCVGTGPEHIKRMRNMLNAIKQEERKYEFEKVNIIPPKDVVLIEKPQKSRLARRLSAGHFVTFVELLPPHGLLSAPVIEKAKEMFYEGIDVINIPDGPRASARMSALSLAIQIQTQVGIETVLHYVCRDRNVIGIQSDLLGAYALGLKNILAITGDPPKLGNYPDATAVFDVDSIGLVNIINRLNHGLDISGSPIGIPTGYFIGVGANPGAVNLDEEIRRLDWKVEAGAEYIVTQPVFDLKIFENFLEKIQHIKLPVIAGLWPLTSIRNAEFMNNEIPGCNVPESVIERLRVHKDSKDDSIKVGIEIARETLDIMKSYIQGVQISAPFGRVKSVVDVMDGFILP
ncbi:MAG: bifunctional homocysteine S-methyltransferase/methylenetetrahydrofolate reductase [Candidatus Kapabacteria bacterium]|nr:bifunctional homocysteine S-methyltransferase/methylenetetrahydrofolate reductase [Ignavibacteriota bacterium]MCW5885713.1 bifunctional homocysteine S-methyltransferase/methylenetetrahydrofolate reductase [Candidatus Kapabacteria bacterium]